MFTVCPKCALTLAVTAADLRAGQGYVRCGRCANVFNALLGLSEESAGGSLQAAPPPAPARPAVPPRAAAPASEAAAAPAAAAVAPSAAAPAAMTAPATAAASATPSSAPATAMSAPAGAAASDTETAAPGAPAVGNAAAPATATATATAPAPAPAPAQVSTPAPGSPPALRLIESPPRPPEPASSTQVEEFRGTGTFETIVLEGDTFLQTEELVPEEAFDDEIAAVSRRIAEAHDEPRDPVELDEEIIDFSDFTLPRGAAPANEAAAQSGPLPFVARENAGRNAGVARAASPAAAQPDTDSNVDEVIEDLEPERAFVGWQVIAGVALAALLLLVQGIDHWRNDLATHPAFEGPLTRLYGALHRSLTPNWNLAAYEVRQLGASSDATDPHNVRVRLSLSNHAAVPQAVPLLRITLLDRYGKSLSAGELTPSQYLPATLRSRSLLDAEQRIDTEVSIPDPTQQASSFELDVCIPASGNSLRCAADGAVMGGSGASS